jgi:hypothetical protein
MAKISFPLMRSAYYSWKRSQVCRFLRHIDFQDDWSIPRAVRVKKTRMPIKTFLIPQIQVRVFTLHVKNSRCHGFFVDSDCSVVVVVVVVVVVLMVVFVVVVVVIGVVVVVGAVVRERGLGSSCSKPSESDRIAMNSAASLRKSSFDSTRQAFSRVAWILMPGAAFASMPRDFKAVPLHLTKRASFSTRDESFEVPLRTADATPCSDEDGSCFMQSLLDVSLTGPEAAAEQLSSFQLIFIKCTVPSLSPTATFGGMLAGAPDWAGVSDHADENSI